VPLLLFGTLGSVLLKTSLVEGILSTGFNGGITDSPSRTEISLIRKPNGPYFHGHPPRAP